MGRPITVRFSYRTVVVPVFLIRSPHYALLVPDTTTVRVEFQLKFDLAAVARAGAEPEAFQQRACWPLAWAGSRVQIVRAAEPCACRCRGCGARRFDHGR